MERDPDRDDPAARAALDGRIVLPLDEAEALYALRGDVDAFEAMAAAWRHYPDTEEER